MRLQLITPPVFTMTGVLTSTQPTITGLSVVNAAPFPTMLYAPFVGQPVAGTGVPDGTTVLSIQSSTALTLTANATASGSTTLTFGAEPVSIDDAKLYCRIQFPDLDVLIGELIATARRYVETRLRSALITQTWIMYLDRFPASASYYNRQARHQWTEAGSQDLAFFPGLVIGNAGVIDLPLPPLQSIVKVQYTDLTNTIHVVDSATYNVSLGQSPNIQAIYNTFWPVTRPMVDAVQITFTSGYGHTGANSPAAALMAIKYLVYTWYTNPQAIIPGKNTIIPDVVESMLSVDDPGIYA